MADLFNNRILCNECGKVMKPVLVSKNGFNLRAVRCDNCKETIFHPSDKQEYEEFIALKQKEFNVKMRMVGNSYAVSIPKEIVDFIQEQENVMDSMVRLCFEEAGRISMNFNTENEEQNENENQQKNSRIVRAREIKVIKNNKPVYHARQFADSANPKNNHTRIFKAKELNENTKGE